MPICGFIVYKHRRYASVLNLDDLAAFVQLVDNGGFTAVNRALGVPKSTFSKRPSELGNVVGVRLDQPTSRGLIVTETGRRPRRRAGRRYQHRQEEHDMRADHGSGISGRWLPVDDEIVLGSKAR
ncbi:LysR family transcriptional regulator [Rhizobium lusitanum]|uniref:LysR family transcriptional regulator n=1 Tax=Rhizobium lusitanum TaxID=293958 RepID=UPI003917F23F